MTKQNTITEMTKQNKKMEKKRARTGEQENPPPDTWCGEPTTPSSHHHRREVYIATKWFGLERELQIYVYYRKRSQGKCF
jgi:hypothetical protein